VSEAELKEAQTQLAEAQKAVEVADKARLDALAEAARANEALALREARDVITTVVAKTDLHEATRVRLVEQLVKTAPITEGKLDTEALTAQVDEAVKSEVAYLAAITGSGRVRDMGGAPADNGVKDSDIAAAFQRMGLSESAAKQAAQGRG
jgi:allophanate hydrolase subunit 1